MIFDLFSVCTLFFFVFAMICKVAVFCGIQHIYCGSNKKCFPESGGRCFFDFCSGVAAFSWLFHCLSIRVFLIQVLLESQFDLF